MNALYRRTAHTAAAVSLLLTGCSSTSNGPAPVPPSSFVKQTAFTKIKHVFILVQENHSFDNYFGLYPALGQTIENLATSTAQSLDCVPDPAAGACQRPFLISANPKSPAYVADAADIGGGNNSRYGQQFGIDHGKMDGFLAENEGSSPAVLPASPSAAQIAAHNNALQVVSTYDCDTVPYLWYWAKNFALFDHYFQAETGQSTPGNVELFAGQIGQTEAAAGKGTRSVLNGTGYTSGVPLGNDNNPPASTLGFVSPYANPDAAQVQSYASLPVLLNPAQDTAAVASGTVGLIPEDIALEAKSGRASIPWAWYEEGTLYPADGAAASAFSAHHEAPLYFDYVNHPSSPYGTRDTLRDNTPGDGLVADINAGILSAQGVYWVKGAASHSSYPFRPADATLAAAGQFTGDDDHPGSGSSDHQVAEAYLATVINAIAQSKYWKDSVIIVTWDDTGGLYDHLPPPQFGATCPDDTTGLFAGTPCGDGVRLPLLVISPFAKSGTVVNDISDGGSITKFIEEVFALPTLASLPDEAAGVSAGLAPDDANALVGDLSGALDPNKLNGSAAPLPPGLAIVPAPAVPPNMNCATLGITPLTSPAAVPAGFQTSGYYAHQTLTGAAAIRQAVPNDDGD